MSVHGVNYPEKDFVRKKLREAQDNLATFEDTTENLNQGLSNGIGNLITRNDALKKAENLLLRISQAPGTHSLTADSKTRVSRNIQQLLDKIDLLEAEKQGLITGHVETDL